MITVGALRRTVRPSMPTEVASSFTVKPCSGTWHMAHEMVLLRDSRRSKKSLRPRATFSGVRGLSAGIGTGGKPSGATARRSTERGSPAASVHRVWKANAAANAAANAQAMGDAVRRTLGMVSSLCPSPLGAGS